MRKQKRGGHHQKECAATYGRMGMTTKKKFSRSVREFVKHLPWVNVTVEEEGMDSGEGERL